MVARERSPRSQRTVKSPFSRFFLALLLTAVIVSGGLVLATNTARAQFGFFPIPLPTTTFEDVPRKTEAAVKKAVDRLKEQLRIVKDVAVKTSIRVFYRTLAQSTTKFVMTAGTGQNPLFITSGDFYQNVFDAAQNDFLDSLGKDVFGVDVSKFDSEREKTISLIVRGILNPGTVCEDDCLREYDFEQRRLDQMRVDLNIVRAEAKQYTDSKVLCPCPVNCPVTYPSNGKPQWAGVLENYTPNIDANQCVQDLESIYSARAQAASVTHGACQRSCKQKRQQATRTDPALNQIVGNEAVSAAVQDIYQPENNELGATLKIINAAQEKGARGVAEEKTVQESKVGPVRTVAGIIKAPGDLTQRSVQKAIDESTASEKVITGSRIADVVGAAFLDALVSRIFKQWFESQCGLNPQACKSPTGTSPQSRFLFGGERGRSTAAQLAVSRIGRADIVSGDPARNAISTLDDLSANGIIDQRFRQAIESGLTVREAIDQGLLDPTRTFGFNGKKEEPIDGYPYRSILYLRHARIVPVGWELAAKFMYEFAPADRGLGEMVSKFDVCGQDAAHDDDPGKNVCVGGAEPGRECTSSLDCLGVAGIADGTCKDVPTPSPFCGLVDPNWVLKAPLTYCRKEGAGEELISKIFVCDEDTNGNGRVDCSQNPNAGGDIGRFEIQRKTEVCVDEPTCVAENEDGSCLSYGYCFEERPSWKFSGTRCPPYYGSCQDYTKPTGEAVAYLSKTVDTNGCSAENAGCQRYCGDQNSTDGSWLCTGDAVTTPTTCPSGTTCTCRLPDGESCEVASGSTSCTTPSTRICTLGKNWAYFDRDAEACDSSQEGCREYIDTSGPTNLLANSGFENYQAQAIDDGLVDVVKGWTNSQVVSDNSGIGPNNTVAVLIPSGGPDLVFTNERLPAGIDTGRPLSKQALTMTFYGKAKSGSCNDVRYGLRSADGLYSDDSGSANYSADWQRYAQTFFLPDTLPYDNNPAHHVIQSFIRSGGCDIVIDNVQLEEAETSSQYKDYATVNGLYLNSNRKSCERVDVGCERYTPVVGGDAITGVVNYPDRCAAEHVGCRPYRKEAIDHVPQRPAIEPVNLVASSARKCQASEVGCEEYTNLDVAAQGGEAREYYTRIRQCVKPVEGDPAVTGQATYFSWVGDDRSGFQLKSFRLKVSNITLGGERGNGPCTNLQIGTSQDDNNPACVDAVATVASCVPGDIGVNPDCTQFFDSSGNVFYRLKSRTIPVSDECRPYRNSIDQRNGDDRVYLVLASQSTTCSAAAAECRAFTGNAGQNTRTIFKDNFEGTSVVTNTWQPAGNVVLSTESGQPGGRSMKATGSFSTQANVLKDKLHRGGTYTLSFWAKPSGATKLEPMFIQVDIRQFVLTPTLALAQEWQRYTVGPVTIDQDPAGLTVQLGARAIGAGGGDASVFIDNVALQEITDSAFLIDSSYRTCPSSEIGCEAYRDRTNAVHNLKSFTRLCAKEAVGCSALIDTQNSSDPFVSLPIRGVTTPADVTVTFVDEQSARCSAENKGCTAFGLPTMDAKKNVAAYTSAYLKNQPDRHTQILCTAQEEQCTEFTSSNGSKAYFKDPGAQTCEFRRLGGEIDYHWYITGTSVRCPTISPPVDGLPTGRACVKFCAGGLRDGLACVGTGDCPAETGKCVVSGGQQVCRGGANDGGGCSTDAQCPTDFGTCTGDEDFVGRTCATNNDCKDDSGTLVGICDLWTGMCPAEQSGCNEYRDPSDPTPCRSNCPLEISNSGAAVPVDEACQPTVCVGGSNDGQICQKNAECASNLCSGEGIPGCRSYFYLKQTIEQNAAECNGRIDLASGCRPFNDTSNPTLNFRGI